MLTLWCWVIAREEQAKKWALVIGITIATIAAMGFLFQITGVRE